MQSESFPKENAKKNCYSTSCDKCDAMQQIFESKMFPIIHDFSKFVKAINKEQSDMNLCMNNTINTVNMLIDQLDENKAALLRAEDEIKNLKSEMQQIKQNNIEYINQVQSQSISSLINDNSISSNNAIDLNSIKNEINNFKKSFKEYQNMQHDINCLKFEVKKLKSVLMFDTNKINQKNKIINDKKSQNKETDSLKTAKVIDLNSTISDSMNLHPNKLDTLKNELANIKENYASQEAIKKIKKQLRKLSNRVDTVENKNKNEIKVNNDSEEESINIKENLEKKRENEDFLNSLQNLSARVSLLESETKKITDAIQKPKVHQIFVDLPNSKACNLLFRSPLPQNANSNA